MREFCHRYIALKKAAQLFVWALLVSVFWSSATAEPIVANFDEANNLYAQGKYQEAVEAYENMARSGVISGSLYFNLGNAYYKAGQNGMAIAYYQMALRLRPRDAEIKANLNFVRNRCNGGSMFRTERWKEWLLVFSVNEWSCATMVLLWMVFGGWSLCLWQGPRLDRIKRYLKVATYLLALISGLFCLRLSIDYGASQAVVVVKEAPVKYGPLDESKVFYQASEGAELTVIETKLPWVQIQDATGRVGWLKESQIKVVK